MTWSPRNGRGDDSDDDDDNNDSLDLSANDLKPIEIKSQLKPESELDSPKKSSKIWSIADTINPRADSAASNISSTSKSSHTNSEDKPNLSTPSTSSHLGQPTSSSAASTMSPVGAGPQGAFLNQNLMSAMAAAGNRLPLPPQFYALMQQQQAAQAQQAAAALQHQQIAAMLRNAGNFPPMLFNNLFMPGMGGLSNLLQPSTSSASPPTTTPTPNDAINTSSTNIDCGK